MNIYLIIGVILVILILFSILIVKVRGQKRKLGYRDRISLENIVEKKPGEQNNQQEKFQHPPAETEESDIEWEMQPDLNLGRNPEESSNKYLTAGIKFLKTQKYRDAILCFNKAIDFNSVDGETYYYRGIVKNKLSLFKDAIDDFTEAILRQLNNPDSFFQRGYAYMQIDEKEDALSDFNNYLMVNKNSSEAYYLRGVLKYDMNDFKSSIDDFSNAIVLNPNHESAYFKRGMARHEVGDTVNSCKDLKIALNKGNFEAYHYLKEYCPE